MRVVVDIGSEELDLGPAGLNAPVGKVTVVQCHYPRAIAAAGRMPDIGRFAADG